MITRKDFENNFEACKQFLEDKENLRKIPHLNYTTNHKLCDGQLVRFQGMVQDMYNPVLYMAKFEVMNQATGEKMMKNGEYIDELKLEENEEFLQDSSEIVTKERTPIYCISIPALNSWVNDYKINKDEGTIREEVSRDRSEKKRNFDEDDSSKMIVEQESTSAQDSNSTSKRLCGEQSKERTAKTSNVSNFNLNFPIENPKGQACLVNVYDDSISVKLNQVIDVIGFLSCDPTLNSGSIEMSVNNFPPMSVVPHLHAIKVQEIRSSIPLPLEVTGDEILRNVETIRADLHSLFSKIMLGDDLAADYMICHLLSSVFERQTGLVLGKFTLNISNVPQDCDYPVRIYKLLEKLVQKSHYFPMSLKELNSVNMIPKKNYESDRLESGVLQLPDNTFLVLDETKMKSGKLIEQGVRNVQALNSLINFQSLDYEFQYYKVQFETNIPVLILSEGKTLLAHDFQVHLDYKETDKDYIQEIFSEAHRFLEEVLLQQFRAYLSMMNTLVYKFNDDLQSQIADDFVRMRQQSQKASPNDLHDLLVLARVFSLSRGCDTLTKETWEIVQDMEQQRKARLAK